MRSNVQTVGSLFSEMHSVSLVRRSRVCYRPAATPHSLVMESSSTLWANMALVAQLKTQPSLLGQVAAHAAANKGERRVLEKCQVCPRGVFFTTKPKQQGHGLVGLEVAELQELHVARRGDDAGPRVDRQVPLGAECNDTLTLAAPAQKTCIAFTVRLIDCMSTSKEKGSQSRAGGTFGPSASSSMAAPPPPPAATGAASGIAAATEFSGEPPAICAILRWRAITGQLQQSQPLWSSEPPLLALLSRASLCRAPVQESSSCIGVADEDKP
eukprot:CAMPEP_0171616630 /NCGR_PEP_ID=MMETSP0990-20121206/13588_1 /TAXON_ID=483369 /ORGANISM="non described non described, Strain CCMP2098" /LENGTH=269 /DNA_ID=CAMNT_0012180925 /DNA_START=551 /DNA_END=1358 /DNA_ORIENTATION=+